MNDAIKNIRLKFECPADWSSMKTIDGGKYCDHCQKKVYDFTDAPQDVFLKILAENSDNICGRFRPEQMAPAPINLPGWKKWVSAAMVMVGINLFNNKVEAQTVNVTNNSTKKISNKPMAVGSPISPSQAASIDKNAVYTATEVEPELIGGYKFIHDNLHFARGMKAGRVYAQFIVNIDGSVSDIQILRGLGPLNDDEVKRLVKLTKWKPGLMWDKPVRCQYLIPVNFQGSVIEK